MALTATEQISGGQVRDADGREVVTVSGGNAAFYARSYGVKADGKTLTDGIITGNQLSSAGTNFVQADVGKLVVVVGAGTVLTATLSAGLTNATPTNTLTVTALAAALPPGPMTISDGGGHTQTVYVGGAPAGATSIPIIGTLASVLTTALTTGGPITTMTVGPLAVAAVAGNVTLVSGTNVQTFAGSSAVVGATSITVTSLTPNFAFPVGTYIVVQTSTVGTLTPNFSYPIGSTLSSMIPPLSTTISSVAGGVATLAASAGTNIASAAEVFYATDDTTAAQACITAAQNAPGGIAEFPNGQTGLSAALVASGTILIRGQGVKAMMGQDAAGWGVWNFPTVAPYLNGSSLVQCSANTDIVQFTGSGFAQDIEKIGLRFAGRFQNTGHGINVLPPVYQSGFDSGPMVAEWRDVQVFGHDGNHFGFNALNMMMGRWDYLHAYGGGGYHFAQNNVPTAYGNLTTTRTYSFTLLGGLAHGMWLDNQRGSTIDYSQWTHPQVWVGDPATKSYTVANTAPPTVAQYLLQSSGTQDHIGFIGPDMECTPAGFLINRPSGRGCYWLGDDPLTGGGGFANTALRGGSQGVGDQAPPVSGTAYQNLWGNQQYAHHQFNLTPAGAAAATSTLSGGTAFLATVLPVVSGTGFSAGQGVQIDSGGNIEFRIIASVSVNNITLTSPCLLAHLSGVAVSAGAAVVVAQVNSVTIGNTTTDLLNDFDCAAIGDTRAVIPGEVKFLVPTGWFMRIDWANATLVNSINATAVR